MFDRFFRVDRVRSPGTGGAGLGLAIVKGIMTLHQGTVCAESSVGHGAKVTMRCRARGTVRLRHLNAILEMPSQRSFDLRSWRYVLAFAPERLTPAVAGTLPTRQGRSPVFGR